MLLTEISSNTAAAAIAIPVIESIVRTLGLNLLPYMLIVTAEVNSAYMLPVSIRAIPVSHGFDASILFKKGFAVSLASVFAIAALGYAFMRFWPGYSVL